MLCGQDTDTPKPLKGPAPPHVLVLRVVAFFFGGYMDWCGIGQLGNGGLAEDCFGVEHASFLTSRASSKPATFTSKDNAFRGVRSGIRRKTNAIIARLKAGKPTTRAARQQDKRAARYLLAAFGALQSGHDGTMKAVLHSGATIGKVLRVARAIWLKETMRQFNEGGKVCLHNLFEANIEAGRAAIRSHSSDEEYAEFEVECFDQVAALVNFKLCSDFADYEESLWTEQDWHDYYKFGTIADPLNSAPERHTNHLILSNTGEKHSLDDISRRVKDIVRSITFRKVGVIGWKSACRVRARCYKLIERGSLEGLMEVRSVLERIQHDQACLGKRGKSPAGGSTAIDERLASLLHGVSGSSGSFMSRKFDLAVYRAMTA